jgi:hypothetical protein
MVTLAVDAVDVHHEIDRKRDGVLRATQPAASAVVISARFVSETEPLRRSSNLNTRTRTTPHAPGFFTVQPWPQRAQRKWSSSSILDQQ